MIYGLVIVVEIFGFGTLAMLYLRQQASALKEQVDIEERRNSLLIMSRRDKLAEKIKIEDGLVWLSEVLSKKLEKAIELFQETLKIESEGLLFTLTREGHVIGVSTQRPPEIKRALKRLIKNEEGVGFSEAKTALPIIKTSKKVRASLIDRDTSNVFDLEIEAAGKILDMRWEESDELWFFVTEKSVT